MITPDAAGRERNEPPRLLAFHYQEGYAVHEPQQRTPPAGPVVTPALVYEATGTTEEDGSPLYEGRILDAVTSELTHERPYQSTFIEAFSRWWTRETELDPPEELLSCVQRPVDDHDQRTDETRDERTGE
jgi:hypothetical protein